MSRRNGPDYHRKIVDSFEVDQAVEKWLETETVKEASRRVGIRADRLRYLLSTSDVKVPRRPEHRRQWRIPMATIDKAVARRNSLETLNQAAKRIGIPRGTLQGKCVKARLKRTKGKFWLVEPEVIDRIAAGGSP